MDADLQKIYDAVVDNRVGLAQVHTKQEANHKENKGKIDVLFIKLDKLKCDSVEAQVDALGGKVTFLSILVVSVIIGGIVLGVWMRAIS